jgi:hypothetical protein
MSYEDTTVTMKLDKFAALKAENAKLRAALENYADYAARGDDALVALRLLRALAHEQEKK